MSQFYCREDELRKLNKRYVGGKFECIIIYGRRRVGKTALINEFCKDKPTIFFSALNTTGKENLEALSKSIMSFERPDMESGPEFQSYDAALDELTALSKESRIVFVIDEYPYLAKAKPAISAMLQHIIDHKWAESQMYLILCGSSMSFMESQVLGKESPLYGRRTGQFKIKALDYKETAVFHPNLSVEENSSLPVLLPHRQLSRPDSGRWRESVGLDHDGSDPLCDRHAGSREREKRKAFQNGREQCFVCPDLKRRSSGGERPDRSTPPSEGFRRCASPADTNPADLTSPCVEPVSAGRTEISGRNRRVRRWKPGGAGRRTGFQRTDGGHGGERSEAREPGLLVPLYGKSVYRLQLQRRGRSG